MPYELDGPGSELLPNTSLSWMLTTDGLLGTTPATSDTPNGKINQLLWKLLQNTGALADLLASTFSRTFGIADSAAPAEGTPQSPPSGAPGSPVTGSIHTVAFTNAEVVYRWSGIGPTWNEIARQGVTPRAAQVNFNKVVIPLVTNDTEAVITIPTVDSEDDAFDFTVDDLVQLYVNNLSSETTVIGVIHGWNLGEGTIRVSLTGSIPDDDNYELVAMFRRTTTLYLD